MSISDKLNHLRICKNDIKNAISEKGVEINDDTKLSEYADKIKEIQTSSGETYVNPNFFEVRTKGNTNYDYLFSNVSGDFSELNVENWDTSKVVSMSNTFYSCSSVFGKLNWDTSNVTNFEKFLYYFKGYIDISNLDFSNATKVEYFFYNANINNVKGIKEIKFPSSITSFSNLFSGVECSSPLDLSSWDVSNVTNMNNTFNGHELNKIDLSNWNTSNVTDMGSIFNQYTSTLEALIIPDWNMDKCTKYSNFFNTGSSNNTKLYYIDLSRSNDSTITKITSFLPTKTESKCGEILIPENSSQTVIDGVIAKYWRPVGPEIEITSCETFVVMDELLNGKTTSVYITNMLPWYGGKEKLKFEISDPSVIKINENGKIEAVGLGSSAIYMTYNGNTVSNILDINVVSEYSKPYEVILEHDSSISSNMNITINGVIKTLKNDFTEISRSGFWKYDVGEPITTISFGSAKSLLNIFKLNTSNVTNMSSMFSGCNNLTSLDVSSWDVSNVTDMSSMFSNCSNLTSLDLSGWDVSNVTNMGSMFLYCNSLTSLDLSSWDVSNVTDMRNMFVCSSLVDLIPPKNIKVSIGFCYASSNSNNLSYDSLIRIIDNLAVVETTQTLTIGEVNIAKLSEDDLLVATNKGWMVV